LSGVSAPAGPRSAARVSATAPQHQLDAPEPATAGVPIAPAREREPVSEALTEPHLTPAPVEAPRSAPVPGGIDTDAIRRSWPDVLAKIFTIRRTTWTFLSEHTQVLDYDGQRLLLGIQTEGLANTFRRGQHAELVRQALSEVLGVDAVVEGISTPESARPVAASPGPATNGLQAHALSEISASGILASGSTASGASAAGVSGSEPSAATVSGSTAPTAEPERVFTPMQRARAAVAQEASTRHTSSSSSVADDSVVSADDEDIEEAGAVGQPVIARILGGTVIGELDQ
jgi:DNA polymerase-3 subunit gamma/tau